MRAPTGDAGVSPAVKASALHKETTPPAVGQGGAICGQCEFNISELFQQSKTNLVFVNCKIVNCQIEYLNNI